MHAIHHINAFADLSSHNRHLYNVIVHHPMVRNLDWHVVISFLEDFADEFVEFPDRLELVRNGISASFDIPAACSTPTELIQQIRRFILASEASPHSRIPKSRIDLLVVVDHLSVSIFRTEWHGSVPHKLVEYAPHGFHQRILARIESADTTLQVMDDCYFEAIAATLRGADRILLFCSGSDIVDSLSLFVSELQRKHQDVALHIVGTVSMDCQYLTGDQLLAVASELFD